MREKIVFPSKQCAHVWAQCSQEFGRNPSGSVSFEGRLFFSYQTPIAHILDTARGERVCLISAEGYSATTKSKHLTAVRYAIRGNVANWYVVPYIDINSRGYYRAPRGCDMYERGTLDVRSLEQRERALHEANFAWLCSNYHQACNSLMRAQVAGFSAQSAHERLSYLADEAYSYAHHFGLPFPTFKPEESMRPILERIDRLRNDPKRRAKAEAREAARERKRLAEAQALALRNAQRIEDFRAGKPNIGHVSDADGCAMLRLSADRLNVETSWGASAPRDHVERVLRFYDIVRARKPAYPFFPTELYGLASRADYTLGHFKLDEIRENGSVKCGCHTITAREIELLRLELLGETTPA